MTPDLPAYEEAARAIVEARSVVVCAHVRPDGDAVGSVLGLVQALRGCGIEAIPTLADEGGRGPITYAFLPGFGLFQPVSELSAPDVFVALDTPNTERIGVAASLVARAGTTVVIDHHPDNAGFGDINLVDPSAAAVGQILWHLIPRMCALSGHPDALTFEVATCLYCALLTDTGGFRYSNTTPDALRDAAEMLEAGAEPAAISRDVYESRSAGAVALAGVALSRLALVNDGHVALSWITDADFDETGALPEETEHLIDMLRMLGDVETVVFLHDRGHECRANLRAKRGFDVGAVARRFGGGGHVAAAGLTYAGAREALLDELLPLLPGGHSG